MNVVDGVSEQTLEMNVRSVVLLGGWVSVIGACGGHGGGSECSTRCGHQPDGGAIGAADATPSDDAEHPDDAAHQDGALVIEVEGADVLGTNLPADGLTRIPIRLSSAGMAGAEVTLSMSRDSGRLDPETVVLDADGTGRASFVPCAAAEPACLGPLRLIATLELLESSVEVDLVEPVGVGWPAACLDDEVVVHLDGNNWILSGTHTIKEGEFRARGSNDQLDVHVTPLDWMLGDYWSLRFGSGETGVPLVAGMYENARFGMNEGHPHMEVDGDYRGCDVRGRFEVSSYQLGEYCYLPDECSTGITDLVLSFQQWCDGDPPDTFLQGCARIVNHQFDPAWCPDEVPPGDPTSVMGSSSDIAIRVVGSSQLGTDLPADGHTRIPVRIRRTGGPPTAQELVLGTSRPGGRFEPAAITLAADDVIAYFVPCDACDVDCPGAMSLTAAAADAPADALAAVDVTLVEPDQVGWPSACLGPGNVVYFDGNDYIFDGVQTLTDATWLTGADASAAVVSVDPTDPAQGSQWSLDFRSPAPSIPMSVGVYEDARRFAATTDLYPSMDVTGDGRGCNHIEGRFQVFEFVPVGGAVRDLRVSFEQRCDLDRTVITVPRQPERILHGCVHYSAP